MKKTELIVALIVVFLLTSAMVVSAAPPFRLAGTYYLQGTSTCVQTPLDYEIAYPFSGFDNTMVLLTNASLRIRHNEGTLVLNRDGSGTVTMKVLQIYPSRLNAGNQPLSVWSGSCDVTYAEQPDGTKTMTFEDCSGTYSWHGLPVPSGSISRTMNVVVAGSGDLFLSQTEPSFPPEVAWEGNLNDNTYREGERECARSLTAVKIQ